MVYQRLESEVAALNIEGKFVNLHPAVAHHHQVVPKYDVTPRVNREIRIIGGLFPLCPVENTKTYALN